MVDVRCTDNLTQRNTPPEQEKCQHSGHQLTQKSKFTPTDERELIDL